jgi:hypothetical protein
VASIAPVAVVVSIVAAVVVVTLVLFVVVVTRVLFVGRFPLRLRPLLRLALGR